MPCAACITLLLAPLIALSAVAADGKLRGTGGLLSIEGSAGGGLIPWGVTASYAEKDQWGVSAAGAFASVSDYDLSTGAIALNFDNRIELTMAEQRFDLPTAIAGNDQLRQRIYSAKFVLAGDLIYSDLPQVSMTLQHKRHADTAQLAASGITDATGTDLILSASKLWLDGIASRNTLLNVNVRRSAAVETGLLGFQDRDYWLAEAALAVLPREDWAVGAEFRQKPGRTALPEDSWADLFVAYFPNKHVSAGLAYLRLGDIAGRKDQSGWYFTLQASF